MDYPHEPEHKSERTHELVRRLAAVTGLSQTGAVEDAVRRRLDFDGEQTAVARSAYRDFGRGSGHPAGLNLGDCSTYALASTTGEPVLFKGEAFARTDLVPALAR